MRDTRTNYGKLFTNEYTKDFHPGNYMRWPLNIRLLAEKFLRLKFVPVGILKNSNYFINFC